MDQQTLLVRRLVAAGAVVLVVVLLVVLIKGCVDSGREAALKDYNRNVRSLVQQTRGDVTNQLFTALGGASSAQPTQVQETINQLTSVADEEIAQARGFDAPDAMKQAQSDLLLALSLRRDGIASVADQIQTALGGTAGASDAVDKIAAQMQAFNAADVIYSQRVAPLILKGLKDNGISASYDGTAGEQVQPYAEFLPAIQWLSPAFVGGQLGAAAASGSNGRPAPGLHGHALDSVSVNGVTLSSSGSNQIPANPPPTFTVSFTNGGANDETNVKVTVEISGAGPTLRAQRVVPSTTAGQQATASVQLTQSPPTSGPCTIKVTVAPVPGETKVDNNSATYTALFQ
ncbi:MAG TPA: hypothetical protein VN635_03140 [Conexibacter sp.]|nr:hypothetical protein [Conexibacter sp.]